MEIIRIIFWAFVFVLCMQLVCCDDWRKHISFKVLNIGLCVKLVVVAAYIIWSNFFSATPPPDPMFLNIIGYGFIFGLVLIIWRIYLVKIVEDGKIYRMTDLKAAKDEERDCYDVYGVIKEHGFSFNVVMYVSENDYLRWAARAMFDKAAKNSHLNVVLADRYVKDDRGLALLRVSEIRI